MTDVYERDDGPLWPPFTIRYNGAWVEIAGWRTPDRKSFKVWAMRAFIAHLPPKEARALAKNMKLLTELRYQQQENQP